MDLATRIDGPVVSWAPFLKSLFPPIIWHQIYKLLIVKNIDNADRYRPHYSPWYSSDFQEAYDKIRPYTLVSIESCWTIKQMLEQALNIDGDILEAGVFRGGTARLLKDLSGQAEGRKLYLFDSFEGMKHVNKEKDRIQQGDFNKTSLDNVKALVGIDEFIVYKQGWIPDTFAGLDGVRLCFSHIDLDLYQSIMDCLEFVYPRTGSGGVIVFDDYGHASCPGARQAVETFFLDKPEKPLALMTGQALVVKL